MENWCGHMTSITGFWNLNLEYVVFQSNSMGHTEEITKH